jgi:hypothetical protein
MGHRRTRQEQPVITIDRRAPVVLLILAVVIGLSLLGKAYTSSPPRVIGRGDWEALKVERKYREELAQLREDLADLAALVTQRPDPVRAELAAARIAQNHASGLALLEQQREIVLAATDVVRDWCHGRIIHPFHNCDQQPCQT